MQFTHFTKPARKGSPLNPSLTVLVPLRNAEHRVAQSVRNILEIVCELSSAFELILLDDGSTDDTPRLIHELAIEYPQIRVICLPGPRGFVATAQRGLTVARGDVVFIQDGNTEPSAQAYRQLWKLRHTEDLSSVRSTHPAHGDGLLDRLVEWGAQVSGGIRRVEVPSGLQLIRRRALQLRNANINLGSRRITRSDLALDSNPPHSSTLTWPAPAGESTRSASDPSSSR